jgi:hypothetical protein
MFLEEIFMGDEANYPKYVNKFQMNYSQANDY